MRWGEEPCQVLAVWGLPCMACLKRREQGTQKEMRVIIMAITPAPVTVLQKGEFQQVHLSHAGVRKAARPESPASPLKRRRMDLCLRGAPSAAPLKFIRLETDANLVDFGSFTLGARPFPPPLFPAREMGAHRIFAARWCQGTWESAGCTL